MHDPWLILSALCFMLIVTYLGAPIQDTIVRRCSWYAACLVGMAILMFFGTACSKQPPPATQSVRPSDPRDAIVAIMRQAEVWRFTDGRGAGDLALAEKPVCSGVAVRTPVGVKLVTAGHCLYGARVGASVLYVTHDQWMHTSADHRVARVEYVDPVLDRAVLAITAMSGLTIATPSLADPIYSYGAIFDYRRLDGRVRTRISDGTSAYYEAQLDVTPGWSGSPVIDALGNVIGIVTACSVDAPRPVCLKSSGIFVNLLALQGVSK